MSMAEHGAVQFQSPSGPFVAKLNIGDLTQLWRTDLANLNATTSPTGVWNYIGGLNVLADGNVMIVAGSNLYKLNGTTGAVEAELALPTGPSLSYNGDFNGMADWPDGTLVLKTQTRTWMLLRWGSSICCTLPWPK